MKIVIDIGNSNIKIYTHLTGNVRRLVISNTMDHYVKSNIEGAIDLLKVEQATICSVVPVVTDLTIDLLSKYNIDIKLIEPANFSKLIDFGNIDYKQMGADRVVTTYAAIEKYGPNVIVFDLGTAITVDVVVKGVYTSGYIFPGMNLQKSALIAGANQLSDFEFQSLQSNNICIDTNSQISDGIIFGIIGAIKEFVNTSKSHFENESTVVLTGGTLYELLRLIGEKKLRKLIDFQWYYEKNLMYSGLIAASTKIRENDESE